MKHDIHSAIVELAAGRSQFVLRGSSLDQLTWFEINDDPVPTQEQIDQKIAELDAAEPMRLLRIERDKRLADVDWKVIREVSQTNSISDNLKNYMQALRDLPTTASPTLDDNWELDHSSIDWPTLEE